jgi:nitric oxide reductase NorD protein
VRLDRFLRNRIIGLSRRATEPMRHWRAQRAPAQLELHQVRRRLELLLGGMYGRPMHIGASRAAISGDKRPEHDVVLPAVLDAPDGVEAAAARYRLLAIEQAERVVRGTKAMALPEDRMERDLFALAEGALVDRTIAGRAPGLASVLAATHARELAARPSLRGLSAAEREVELVARTLLDDEHRDVLADAPEMPTPADSLNWARAEAARIRGASHGSARYRGLRSLKAWQIGSAEYRPEAFPPMPSSSIGDIRTPSAASPSPHGNRAAESDEGTEGGSGASPDDNASTTSPSPAATSEQQRFEHVDSGGDGSSPAQARADEPRAPTSGTSYPEWNEYAGRYEPDAATVHDEPATEGDEHWASDVLDVHAAIVRQVRARFSQLRAHRERFRAQQSGDELDLEACVAALVDLRMRRVPSDRLYLYTKPARRTLAIALLVDMSGSTSSRVSDDRTVPDTVLDVERMTVLLASEALDALGDPYAVFAFSGRGAHDVRMRTVKHFIGGDRGTMHRRIAGLAPMGNTRLGAALRHAAAALNAQPAERRLLLLLSDGKPNDVHGYQGVYAIEDSRRALAEARAAGVHPFCLTVDREETEYLPHLFGTSGYRLMRAPEQLPEALLRVVEQLLPR